MTGVKPEATEWTEWTLSLAVAEALTDWTADHRPGKWTGQDDQRPVVMVLLACAIQAASRDRGIQPANPDQLEALPLELVAEQLANDRALALLEPDRGLGPVSSQLGAREFDDLARVSIQPDRRGWPRVVDLAVEVITSHTAEHRTPDDATIAKRRKALVNDARRRMVEQLGAVFGDHPLTR